jgi:hypothetical protein
MVSSPRYLNFSDLRGRAFCLGSAAYRQILGVRDSRFL